MIGAGHLQGSDSSSCTSCQRSHQAFGTRSALLHRCRLYDAQKICAQTTAINISELPATFKRVVAKHSGRGFKEVACIQELPLPRPGLKEVLVKILYAGVNGGCETFRCRGEFAFAANKSLRNFPLGAEGCGIVAAVGEGVKSLRVGQAVTCNSAGAFAEFVIARDVLCTPVEEPSPEATALALSGVTACAALEVTAGIQAGETVLVTAAAGGTGHFAVQLAKLAGCHVIATCGSQAKAQALRGLGVDCVIDYTQQDVDRMLEAQYPGGVDVVYEGVGGSLRQIALKHLAPSGRLLQVGYISEYPHTQAPQAVTSSESNTTTTIRSGSGSNESGQAATAAAAAGHDVPPAEQLFWEGLNVQRGQQQIIGSIWPKDLKAIIRCRRRVFELHRKGQLQVWVDQSRSFRGVDCVADAVDHMLHGSHIGKVVVTL